MFSSPKQGGAFKQRYSEVCQAISQLLMWKPSMLHKFTELISSLFSRSLLRSVFLPALWHWHSPGLGTGARWRWSETWAAGMGRTGSGTLASWSVWAHFGQRCESSGRRKWCHGKCDGVRWSFFFFFFSTGLCQTKSEFTGPFFVLFQRPSVWDWASSGGQNTHCRQCWRKFLKIWDDCRSMNDSVNFKLINSSEKYTILIIYICINFLPWWSSSAEWSVWPHLEQLCHEPPRRCRARAFWEFGTCQWSLHKAGGDPRSAAGVRQRESKGCDVKEKKWI